jgi:hypothetical protein
MAELAEGLGFDLADAFARDVELLADFLERAGPTVLQPEPELQHAPFPAGQRVEHGLHLLLEQLVGRGLGGRERRVLQLRFGLEDGRARTLEEVGKEFNVTRERIRQIEAKALRKLRHPSRSRKLKDYLE